MAILKTLASWISPIMPAACILCSATADKSGLCTACLASLPHANGTRCPICALPVPVDSQCGRCIQRLPRFDHIIAALDYAFPVDRLVAGLKYARDLPAARTLAFLLARKLDSEPYPDMVIPMPIAPARLRDRGFNHASEIARYACADFGLRISHDVALRTLARLPQASLPWRERAKNVRGVFRCNIDLSGKTIAVIDDVLTTGATLDELASVLKRSGAREVIGWIVARTPSQR